MKKEQDTIIELEKDVIILTTKTVEKLLSLNPDALSLYLFYTKNAKIQETPSIYNTEKFGMKGMGWGREKYRNAKKVLTDEGMIEEVIRRNDKKQITGHFIYIKYIWGQNKTKETIEQVSNPVEEATSSDSTTNALSNKNINASINTNKSIPSEEINKITLPLNRGNLPSVRLDSIYCTLFNDKYGFNPSNALIKSRRGVFKDLVNSYSELQIARLLICFFEWRGMLGDSDWEEKKITSEAHSIYTFKRNLSQYEARVRNVEGENKQFDDDSLLLPIIGKYIISLSQS